MNFVHKIFFFNCNGKFIIFFFFSKYSLLKFFVIYNRLFKGKMSNWSIMRTFFCDWWQWIQGRNMILFDYRRKGHYLEKVYVLQRRVIIFMGIYVLWLNLWIIKWFYKRKWVKIYELAHFFTKMLKRKD